MLLTLPQITHEARGERRKRLKQKYGFKFQLKTRKMHHRESEAGMGMDSLEDSDSTWATKKEKEKKKAFWRGYWRNPLRCTSSLRTFSTHFKRYSCSSPARGQGEVSCIVIVFVRMNMQDRGKASSTPVRQVNADRARQPTINIWLKPSGGWGTQRGLWSPSGLQKQGRWHYFCLRASMLDCHVKLFVAYASC